MSDPDLGLLVIGSGPAGLAAAKAYRAAGGQDAVLLVSADRYPPYDRPPLSKDFLRGEVEADSLPLERPSFYEDQRIGLRLATRVAAIDPVERTATFERGAVVSWNACVLATGSAPTPLPVPGADHPAVHHLRSREDGQRLRTAAAGASSAVVVGSGFVGCEAAYSLVSLGLDVTMVTREVLPQAERLGAEVGERIATWLRRAGVTIVSGATVERLEDGVRVVADGTPYDADLVLVAGGVTPHAELAARAGLLVEDGRIVVDEQMRTSADGVYAAGDVAWARNGRAGRHLVVEHWGDADRMGAIAGTSAAGGVDGWQEVPGFWSQIGPDTLKYVAWGDGYGESRLVDHGDGAFTVWYGHDGATVGVLTHGADDDDEKGAALVAQAGPLPGGPLTAAS